MYYRKSYDENREFRLKEKKENAIAKHPPLIKILERVTQHRIHTRYIYNVNISDGKNLDLPEFVNPDHWIPTFIVNPDIYLNQKFAF